jgi:hypothetical protein
VEELLGDRQAATAIERAGADPELAGDGAPEVAIGHAEVLGQGRQGTLDQEAAVDRGDRGGDQRTADRAAARRDLGATAQARSVAGGLGLGRESIVGAAIGARRPGRTHRSAVDAGGRHRDHEAAIEAAVLGHHRLPTRGAIELHGRGSSGRPRRRLAVSGPRDEIGRSRSPPQIF